jgi:hypothetical protein
MLSTIKKAKKMRTQYFIEQYGNQWQVRSKIGRELFGQHQTLVDANIQQAFLESLAQGTTLEARIDAFDKETA